MARTFNLQLTSEPTPILIVADTKIDAQCQAMEIRRRADARIIYLTEVYPTCNVLSSIRFEQQFNNIF